jgi:hypothetical protein
VVAVSVVAVVLVAAASAAAVVDFQEEEHPDHGKGDSCLAQILFKFGRRIPH